MKNKTLTLKELAGMSEAKLIGNADYEILNVESLEEATFSDVSFLGNPRYISAMQRSSAGAIFITQELWEQLFSKNESCRNFLIVENPTRAFQIAIDAFHGHKVETTGFEGIHPMAVVHPTAKLGSNVTLGPHTVIDKGVVIGDNSFIGSGCYIGPYTKIGSDCCLHPNVTIREHCTLGNRVIIQPGAVIGSCGFGYQPDKSGRHQKLNQVGDVVIGDDVEIGANAAIDRARFKSTIIGRGTKIDNLVQIGHGAVIGEDNLIIAMTGMAGSSKTGKHVILAGHVGVAGHITLKDGVVVAAYSGVTRSLEKGKYGGIPAKPLSEYNRNAVHLRNVEKTIHEVKNLKKQLSEIEAKLTEKQDFKPE